MKAQKYEFSIPKRMYWRLRSAGKILGYGEDEVVRKAISAGMSAIIEEAAKKRCVLKPKKALDTE